jgi:hypothetical protein
MTTASFSVSAKNNCVVGGIGLLTNISVKLGQTLMITADPTDTWAGGASPDLTSNANGVSNPLGKGGGIYTRNNCGFHGGSLIGSLDGGKTFFPVGTHTTFPVLGPGTLSLYYWDTANQDNSGDVRVDVTVADTAAVDKERLNPAGTRWRVAYMDASAKFDGFHPVSWDFVAQGKMSAADTWTGIYTPVAGDLQAFDCEVTNIGGSDVADRFRVVFLTAGRFIATKDGQLYRYGEKL